MKDQDVRESLDELKQELALLGEEQGDLRARVARWIEELETELRTPSAASDGRQPPERGILEDIRGAVEEFEVEHPRLTGILNQLATTLSNIGI